MTKARCPKCVTGRLCKEANDRDLYCLMCGLTLYRQADGDWSSPYGFTVQQEVVLTPIRTIRRRRRAA
jgi:uncharacterized protein (DUF983 family)